MKAILFLPFLLLFILQNPESILSSSVFENESVKEYFSESNPVFVNKRVYPGTNHQVQTSIATHPSNPLIMAASAITDVYPGGYTTGAYVTTNGGINWTGTNAIKTNLNNIITTIGDPTIVIDKNGTIVITYTYLPSGASDLKAGISYSTNNGLFWSASVEIPGVGRCDKVTSIADNSPLSPNYGKIYIVYSDFMKSGLYFSCSSNGGVSWDTVKRVSPPFSDARVGASIALGKTGEMYVSWPFFDNNSLNSYIGFAKSTDAGQNWVSQDNAILVNLTRLAFRVFVNGCRQNGLPVLSVDNSGGPRDGTIYISCTEKAATGSPATDDYDILLRSSSNMGDTWNSPVKVNQDNTGLLQYQFYPVTSIDRYGGVNVVYYDTRNTLTNDSFEVYLARSLDGGISFDDHLICDHKFKLKTIEPTLFGVPGYIGTYIGLTTSARTITPLWFDNSTEKYQAWTAEIEFGADIKIIPEGLYDVSSNSLLMKDTVRAYLRNSYSPYHIVDSSMGTLDSLTFIAEMVFPNSHSGEYYLEINHRNSLMVWSNVPVSYSTGGKMDFDFTSNASQAFGNNQILAGNMWCIYSGDVDKDGNVDMLDLNMIFNDVSSFTSGYVQSDVNADGTVDLLDLNVAFSNCTGFRSAITP